METAWTPSEFETAKENPPKKLQRDKKTSSEMKPGSTKIQTLTRITTKIPGPANPDFKDDSQLKGIVRPEGDWAVVGMITLEDILELILGEAIYDELDVDLLGEQKPEDQRVRGQKAEEQGLGDQECGVQKSRGPRLGNQKPPAESNGNAIAAHPLPLVKNFLGIPVEEEDVAPSDESDDVASGHTFRT